jgi:hypothetical protein
MRRPIVGFWFARGSLGMLLGLVFLAGCRTSQAPFQGPVPVGPAPGAPFQPVPPPPPLSGGGHEIVGGNSMPPPPAGQVVAPPVVGSLPPKTPAPPVKDPYVAELLTILQETKSVDAFLVTLDVLVETKADHRVVVPAVIRSAERLGLLAQHMLKDDNGRHAEVSGMITDALDRLIHGDGEGGCEKCTRPAPTRPATPAGSYGTKPQKNSEKEPSTPILRPLNDGKPLPECTQPPDRAEILRAMSPVPRGVPVICEVYRDDPQFETQLLVEKVDPARFYPLIGPAQLHQCHWKCTIRYNETTELAYPFPVRATRPRVEVVYIDRDHLHLWTPPPSKQQGKSDTSARISPTKQADKLRQIEAEWQRLLTGDQPSRLTPQRVHGGIEP